MVVRRAGRGRTEGEPAANWRPAACPRPAALARSAAASARTAMAMAMKRNVEATTWARNQVVPSMAAYQATVPKA